MAATGVATYKIYDGSFIGAVDLNSADTVARLPLGTGVKGRDFASSNYGEAEFRYVKFTGACNLGDFVLFAGGDNTAVQIASGAPTRGLYGVCMATQTGAPSFGWVLIRGIHDNANVAGTGAAGSPLYGASGSAGSATTAVTAGDSLSPAFVRVQAAAGGKAIVELYWPSAILAL